MTATPKRYYGWYIAVTLAITETISWGIIFYAFSVFITPMEAELGWTRGQLTGGFSLMLLCVALAGFPVGVWVDKYGTRALMTLGSTCAALLVVAWSQVTDLTLFYLIWAGLGISAAAVLYDPAFAAVTVWFTQRRGTALAMITFAAGLASTLFIPLADALLNWLGWRDAVLTLGIFLGMTTILPHALILRRSPQDMGIAPDIAPPTDDYTPPVAPVNVSLSGALHNRFFWMLTLAFSLSYLSGSAIRVHFIPLLIDSGMGASRAAFASGMIGIMQVVGRVFFAPLDNRLSGRMLVMGIFALQTVGLSLLLFGTSGAVLALFIILFGMAHGANTLARPAILAGIFGTSHFGRISSVMMVFLTIASTVAPVGAGLLYDQFGSYRLMLWGITLLAGVATGVMLFTRDTE